MRIQLGVQEVFSLLSNKLSVEQVAVQVEKLAARHNLLLPSPQPGAGYLQWNLPGEGWVPVSKADDSERALIAAEYKRRCEALQSALTGSPIQSIVVQVPSPDYIYYRQQEGKLEIALVAWGYRFPDVLPCQELEAWIVKNPKQKVNVGFLWDGRLLPSCQFRFNGFGRITQEDGLFHVDNLIPVGESYPVEAMCGERFTLLVEDGKEDYIFDLTRFFTVRVHVLQDEKPVPEEKLSISFNTDVIALTTDASGQAECRIPYLSDKDGCVLSSQPVCEATCKEETYSCTPDGTGDVVFEFSFKTPALEEPSRDTVTQGEPPIEDTPLPPSESPGEITIRLFDYAGDPLPDMPFTLVTQRHGNKELVTDAKGCCRLSREHFSSGEKMKVKFTVTKEYQKTHNIHSSKTSKKR